MLAPTFRPGAGATSGVRTILANLLPGVRESRTPLVVGYVWTLALWLGFSDLLPDPATPGPVSDLYALIDFFGEAALIAAVSMVAYLIGSMLTVDSQSRILSALLSKMPGRLKLSNHPKLLVEFGRYLSGKGPLGAVAKARDVLSQERGSLPTKLMAESERLFEHFDRASSEATLRLSLAPALAGLAGVVLWRQSISIDALPVWAIMFLLVTFLIFYQGLTKRRSANDILIQAIIAGTITTESTESALEMKRSQKLPQWTDMVRRDVRSQPLRNSSGADEATESRSTEEGGNAS